MIKSKRNGWVVNIARIKEEINSYNTFVSKPEANLEDLCTNKRIILKWIKEIRCENVDRIDLAQVGNCGALL
jgi:hypothetical protein